MTAERRKELSELFTMKIERKGQGTGRKKNKRKAAEALEGTSEATTNSENGSEQKKPKFEKAKKVLKDKTGLFEDLQSVILSYTLCFTVCLMKISSFTQM